MAVYYTYIAMHRTKPTNNTIYHVYNRGVDKRKVFLCDADYLRFIHDLFEFNDTEPALKLNYYIGQKPSSEVGLPKMERKPRKLIVDILAFCLMPNHFHLMLRQNKENGITDFMHKLGTGYTNYFNKKYERSGALFQGKYKFVPIKEDGHFVHLPYYIHLNPLDLKFPEWKDKRIKDRKKAIKFLENYRWSSFLDYIGKKNFPSVTSREFLLDFFSGPGNYKKETLQWLEEIKLGEVEGITLE